MRKDMVKTAVGMLEEVGAKHITPHDTTDQPGERVFSVHDMGIARMGHDPKTSVLVATIKCMMQKMYLLPMVHAWLLRPVKILP